MVNSKYSVQLTYKNIYFVLTKEIQHPVEIATNFMSTQRVN